MAKEKKLIFQMAEVLAKMHLAALMGIGREPKKFIVNTGVKDDDPKATPDNPGKVTFDTENESGVYELGYVTQIEGHINFSLTTLMNRLDQFCEQLKKSSNEVKAELKSQGLNIANPENISKETKQVLQSIKDFVSQIRALPGIEESDLAEDPWIDGFREVEGAKLASIDDTKKDIEEAIKAEAEKNGPDAQYQKLVDEARKTATEKLNAYLEVFAGKKNFIRIGPDDDMLLQDIVVSYKVKDSNDKNLVKDFKIQPISDGELKQAMAKMESTPANDKDENFTQNICFAVRYKLTKD